MDLRRHSFASCSTVYSTCIGGHLSVVATDGVLLWGTPRDCVPCRRLGREVWVSETTMDCNALQHIADTFHFVAPCPLPANTVCGASWATVPATVSHSPPSASAAVALPAGEHRQWVHHPLCIAGAAVATKARARTRFPDERGVLQHAEVMSSRPRERLGFL